MLDTNATHNHNIISTLRLILLHYIFSSKIEMKHCTVTHSHYFIITDTRWKYSSSYLKPLFLFTWSQTTKSNLVHKKGKQIKFASLIKFCQQWLCTCPHDIYISCFITTVTNQVLTTFPTSPIPLPNTKPGPMLTNILSQHFGHRLCKIIFVKTRSSSL